MGSATLVEERVNAGRALVEQLDKTPASPTSAFWFFYPDTEQWRLMIASPYLDKMGPMLAYKSIAEASRKSAQPMDLADVKVANTRDDLISALRIVIATPPAPAISDIRMSDNYINGIHIPEVLIYRLVNRVA